MAARQQATVMRPIEIRVGSRFGPPDADGRRGNIAVSGSLPEELAGWFRYKDGEEGLKVHPLPARAGAVWIYFAGELLLEPAAPDGSDEGEVQAHKLLHSIDGLEANASDKRRGITRLEEQLKNLRDEVEAQERKLQRIATELSDLEPRLKEERGRYTAEVARMDQELTAYRREIMQAKVSQMQDLTLSTQQLGLVAAEVRGQAIAQIKAIDALTGDLLAAEEAASKNAERRKLSAQQSTTNVLEMLQGFETAGIKELTAAPAPPADTLGGGVGAWVKGGGIDKVLDFGERVFDRVYPDKNPAGQGPEDG